MILKKVQAVFMAMLASSVGFAMEHKSLNPQEPAVFIHYAVFFSNQKPEPDQLLKQCDLKGIARISDFDSPIKEPGILVQEQGVNKPDMRSLQYFGRGFDQSKAERLMKSDYALSFVGAAPFDKEHLLLKKITQCVGEIAEKYDAFIMDVADSLTFTSEAFENIRVAEIAKNSLSASQFGVRAYRVETGIRSVSMGLEKFGQPNLVIENFSEQHMNYMDKFFTLLLQYMIESPSRVMPGAVTVDVKNIMNSEVRTNLFSSIKADGSGKIELRLQKALSLQGDPSELLAISFENAPGERLWSEQAQMLHSIFGTDRDISNVSDPLSLDAAIASARKKVKHLLKEEHTLQKDAMRLLIATALEPANEVVWVEVNQYNDQKGEGILLSEPLHIENLHSGMIYEFDFDTILDYKLYGPEGIIEQGGVDELARQI